jgi:hypothetical protein
MVVDILIAPLGWVFVWIGEGFLSTEFADGDGG